MEQEPLGLEPRASHPALTGDARRCGDRSSSTDLKHALRHRPSLQSCVFTQCVRPRVARDIAEVESNRPKSPVAFDFARRPAVVWSRSAVCLRIRPSNLAGPCSMPSALRRARARRGRMSETSQEQVCPVQGFNGSAVLIGVRSGTLLGPQAPSRRRGRSPFPDVRRA